MARMLRIAGAHGIPLPPLRGYGVHGTGRISVQNIADRRRSVSPLPRGEGSGVWGVRVCREAGEALGRTACNTVGDGPARPTPPAPLHEGEGSPVAAVPAAGAPRI